MLGYGERDNIWGFAHRKGNLIVPTVTDYANLPPWIQISFGYGDGPRQAGSDQVYRSSSGKSFGAWGMLA